MNATKLLTFPLPALVALVATFLLVPLLKRVSPWLGLIDVPSERRIHLRPIPLCGGLAVFFGLHAACALLYFAPIVDPPATLGASWWLRLLVTSGAILVVGLIDDRFEMRPWLKLAGQFAVANLAFHYGMRVTNALGMRVPFGVDYALTMFWFMGAMNAFNLIDGMDGVAGGLGMIAALAIGGQLLLQDRANDALVAFSLAAACLAFLRYNFHPATVFLGDSGSMFIGFTLAALAVSTGAKGTTLASLAVPLLAVGIPAFDTFLAIWRRSVRRLLGRNGGGSVDRGRVFGADLDHLHHRLRGFGLSQRQVALALYVGAVALVSIPLASLVFRSLALAIYLVAFLFGVYVVVRHLAYVELWDSVSVLLDGIRRPPRRALAVVLYPVVDIGIMVVVLGTILYYLNSSDSLGALRTSFIAHAPWWIAFPFLSLIATRTYKRVWSRSRISEFATTGIGLLAGCGLSYVVFDCHIGHIGGNRDLSVLVLAVIYFSCISAGILGLRILPRLIQDLGASLRNCHAHRFDREVARTLVYSAGWGCILFLRSRSYQRLDGNQRFQRIIGLLDDDSNLHGRYVHGYRVLGGIDQLAGIVARERVESIVVATRLRPEVLRRLRDIAAAAEVRVSEWHVTFQTSGSFRFP